MAYTSDVAFSDTVKRIQSERGSRRSYARMEESRGGFSAEITPEAAAFIAERNSAYLSTASASGQPYVQHRGGPRGFIKVIDAKTLAFADFAGNRQYITTGNLTENNQAFLFLMNYLEQERLKFWGRARVVTDDAKLFAELSDPEYPARVEQAIVFDVTAWDGNCPQHIPQLVDAAAVRATVETLQQRIADLEMQLARANDPSS